MRKLDQQRYVEFSGHASGEVMSAVFAERPRAASRGASGQVVGLIARRLGAGWGVLQREIRLRRAAESSNGRGATTALNLTGSVTALNLTGAVPIVMGTWS